MTCDVGINILLTENRVLKIDLTGLVTQAVIGAVVRNISASAYGHAKAFVLRADSTLLALSEKCLESINIDEVLSISGAFVVPEINFEVVQSYTARMARNGIVRKVFTCRVKALAWATQQAQMALAQEQWVKERRPLQAVAG